MSGFLLLVGMLVGASLPFGLHGWVVKRMDRRGGSKYVVESANPWVNLFKALVWLATTAVFGVAGAIVASLLFEEESGPWALVFGFGIGLGLTILMPFYEMALRRKRRRRPGPTDEEIEAAAGDPE